AARRMSELQARSGVQSIEQLHAADAAWTARDSVETQLRAIDAQILERSSFAAQILQDERADLDDDALAAQAAQLREQLQLLASQLDELQKERDALIEQIGEVETSQVVVVAQQERANALLQIEQLTAEYRSLALQEQQLAAFMEEQTSGSMGPVFERASEYFARLTCGRFSGLRTVANEAGGLELRADRADAGEDASQAVTIDGLSEGTLDQLFLALRLATLVTALDAGSEPMPLMVDDILLTFDDERSAATLELLGELAERMQIIFLTHHERLVEIARDVVDHEVLDVINLDAQDEVA
ncbi:MAG: hypothetical protein ABI200_04310, partial [Gaiellales bacterium]